METNHVKERQQKIEEAQQQMMKSVKEAFKYIFPS